jgi:hypothetical protein
LGQTRWLAYGAGHPRLGKNEGVDGRDNKAFTPVFDGLCPAMTNAIHCERIAL